VLSGLRLVGSDRRRPGLGKGGGLAEGGFHPGFEIKGKRNGAQSAIEIDPGPWDQTATHGLLLAHETGCCCRSCALSSRKPKISGFFHKYQINLIFPSSDFFICI